jgi:hypothetical protein
MFIDFEIKNESATELTDFATQYNSNSFGLVAVAGFELGNVAAGGIGMASQEVALGGAIETMEPVNLLQVAVKNSEGVFYFSVLIPDGLI